MWHIVFYGLWNILAHKLHLNLESKFQENVIFAYLRNTFRLQIACTFKVGGKCAFKKNCLFFTNGGRTSPLASSYGLLLVVFLMVTDLTSTDFTCGKYSHHSKMWFVGHVACMEKRRDAYRVLVGKHEGKRPLGRLRLRWSIILKLIFKKWGGGTLTGCSGAGCGQVVESCKFSKEPPGSMKCREFFDIVSISRRTLVQGVS